MATLVLARTPASDILVWNQAVCQASAEGPLGFTSCISFFCSHQIKCNALHLHSLALSASRHFTLYTASVPQPRFPCPACLLPGLYFISVTSHYPALNWSIIAILTSELKKKMKKTTHSKSVDYDRMIQSYGTEVTLWSRRKSSLLLFLWLIDVN